MTNTNIIYRFCTANYILLVEALPDEFNGEYMEPEDLQHIRAKLKRGTLQVFCVKASITHIKTNTELSSDYLGECLYKNITDFKDNLRLTHQKYGSYFHDMVKTVIQESRGVL